MRAFRRLSVDDVTRSIGQLPDMTSAADPLPASILKQIAFQSLARGWLFPCWVQGGVRYTNYQETRARSNRRQLVPTYFKSVGIIEAHRARRHCPAARLFDPCWSPTATAVRFSTRPLNINRRSSCPVGYASGCRSWRTRRPGPSGLLCR